MNGGMTGLSIVLAVFVMAACRGDEAEELGSGVVVDTLEGVEIVTNRAERRPQLDWTVGAPSLELGRIDGEDHEVFGSIGGIVVGSGGRVYVGDTQALEVRVFGSDGTYQFAFGGKGEGPGEFENIDAMRLTPGGELLVRDVNQGRVSVFAPDGSYRREIRIERPFFQYENRPTLWADTAGRVFDWLLLRPGDVDTMGVAVYDAAGTLVRKVVTDVFERPMIRLMRDGRPLAGLAIPRTPFASGAVDQGGRIVSGVGDTYELDVRTAEGVLIRSIRRDIEPGPAPGWLADTVRIRIASMIEDMGGGTPEDYDLPRTLPAYSRVMIDDLDYLWVARNGDQGRLPTRFDIFDPEGRFEGTLELPELRLMHLGRDFLAGIAYDELGVERAVILPLERG